MSSTPAPPPPRSIWPQAERVASTLYLIRRVAAVAMYAAPIAAFLSTAIPLYDVGPLSLWDGLGTFLSIFSPGFLGALLSWTAFGFIWFFAGYFEKIIAQLDNNPRQKTNADT